MSCGNSLKIFKFKVTLVGLAIAASTYYYCKNKDKVLLRESDITKKVDKFPVKTGDSAQKSG